MSTIVAIVAIKLTSKEWGKLRRLWGDYQNYQPYSDKAKESRSYIEEIGARFGYTDWNQIIDALDQAKPDWRGYVVDYSRRVAA